ncbi:MAG TPA: EAL domain-containing protein [Thermoanaerobaculia bacterium]|nr:EAL domain-containing protein [Thermoanaerobaculia bacterium]
MNEHFFALDMVAIFRQTLDGRLLDCNEACARMLGYASRDELLAVGQLSYVNASDSLSIAAALPDLTRLSNVELAVRRKDGTVVWVLQNLKLVEVEEASKVWIEAAMFDVTEQRAAAQRLEFQAYHDGLTALPNRSLAIDRLSVALAGAKRRRRPVAVMILDLDHFELINTTFGHGLADRLLREVAERLTGSVRNEDTVCRFGSDEFMIILAEMSGETDAAIAAQRILDSVSRPVVIDGQSVEIKASVGISVSPQDGTTADALVKNATTAMFQAKDRGRNMFRFHVPELNARAVERASLVASLRRALERNEFELHYHPEVNVQTGRIDCIEALVRWRHPDIGLVAPADFFPAAEQGNLDGEIGRWIINEACRQIKLWHDEGMPGIRMAVNLSARQFHDRNLQSLLNEAINDAKLDPGALELEVAEATIARSAWANDILANLKGFGARIAVDDFGAGGCSFTDLRSLPVDTLKIAPTFIHSMMQRNDDAAMVQAMITMAKGLDLRIIAEGVESKEQLSYLLARRCTDMQGYFFGKPLPAFALADTLRMQH